MPQDDLAKIDLNLLKLLKVLGEEKNTRRAGERMFVGQPTISKSLKKLREMFKDELFTREAHGLRPTAQCELILSRLPAVFEAVENTLNPHLTFDPEKYTGEISIAINPVLYQPIIKAIYPKLRKLAPNAEYRFVNWSWDTESKLQQGQVSLGVNLSPTNLSLNIRSETICPAEYKLCCSVNSPFIEEGITYQSLAKNPLVLMIMPNFSDNTNLVELILKRQQITPNILLRSDQLDVCLDVLKQEPAGMPVSSLVEAIISDELVMLSLPQDIPVPPGDISLFYSNIYGRSPKLIWLKSVLHDAIFELNQTISKPN